ncbi:uncharacterized protein LOC107695764, partial [Tachysurus ichikawai]
MLQVALDDVDWDKFRASSSDVSEFTDVALSFVNTLAEHATDTITIRTFSNQKPWVDRTTHAAVNKRTAAYNAGLLSGNRSEYKASCYALRRAVRDAKHRYTKYYGRFESNLSSASLPISASGSSSHSSDNQVIAVSEDEVRRALKRVNVRKAAGPDGISGRILRSCADQLAGFFTSIFNESLATAVVPTSFKKSVIIQVPKNNKPSCLNDYRPVALTSIVMKVFERLVKNVICSSIPGPSPVCFSPNRSTDDAILHSSLTHIDSNNRNYARLLFIDYSSAFNTIVPIKLASKLMDLGLNSSLCNWRELPLRQTSSGESRPVHLQLHHPERWSPTRLCPESPALLSLHT